MKLIRYGEPGQEKPGVIIDDKKYGLTNFAGDYDQAFVWFDRAYEEKSNILQWIKVEPFPDAMRNDPRFADLLRRVGLS